MLQEHEARLRDGSLEPIDLHPDKLEVQQSEIEVVGRVDVTGQEGHQLRLFIEELLRIVLLVGHVTHKGVQEDRLDLEILRSHEQAGQASQLDLARFLVALEGLAEIPVQHVHRDEGQGLILFRQDVADMHQPVHKVRS